MKKKINIIILVLLLLNIALVGLVFASSYEKNKIITLDGGNLVSQIEITYDVQANPLATVEVQDLTTTDAAINSCVGNLGQSINISGNFFDFQLKEAEVSMTYDETKLGEVDEENIGVLWYDKDNNQMVEIDTDVDVESNTISFTTDHFSEYILVNLETWHSKWNERLIREKDEDASAFDIAFVIDDSGSMTQNDSQNARLVACEEFINILRDKDGYAIISFESSATELQTLTTDKSDTTVSEALDKFYSSGGTNIAGGLEQGISTLDTSETSSRIIVLLTDGEDNALASQKDEIITEALNLNITIYSIFLNASTEEYNPEYTTDIEDIALETGGNFYYISSDEAVDIFNDISKEAVGVENGTDTDGDGIIDEIEEGGIRNQFGEIIYLDPNNADTDGDGISDKDEIGEAKENEDGAVYYEFVSDPLVANEEGEGYKTSISGTSVSDIASSLYLRYWSSGFKLNENAFKFRNMNVLGNNGICAGIAYVVEQTYNYNNGTSNDGEEIELSIDSPTVEEFGQIITLNSDDISNEYSELKEFVEYCDGKFASLETIERTEKDRIEALKGNPNTYVFENIEELFEFLKPDESEKEKFNELYKTSDYVLYSLKTLSFNINSQDIKNGNAYFYPTVGVLKKFTSKSSNNLIKYSDLSEGTADDELVKGLYYYWQYEVLLSATISTSYNIDYSTPATEETITKLKKIFSSGEIIRIGINNHVINGYALMQVSETEYRLYVYDSNYPYYTGQNRYIRLLAAYGSDDSQISYVVGKDDGMYNYEGSGFVDEDGTFQLLLEKDDEILNGEKIDSED